VNGEVETDVAEKTLKRVALQKMWKNSNLGKRRGGVLPEFESPGRRSLHVFALSLKGLKKSLGGKGRGGERYVCERGEKLSEGLKSLGCADKGEGGENGSRVGTLSGKRWGEGSLEKGGDQTIY